MTPDQNGRITAAQMVMTYLKNHPVDALTLLKEKREGLSVVFLAIKRGVSVLAIELMRRYPELISEREDEEGNTPALYAVKYGRATVLDAIFQLSMNSVYEINDKDEDALVLCDKYTPEKMVFRIKCILVHYTEAFEKERLQAPSCASSSTSVPT